MVPNEDRRPRREMLLALDDFEAYAGGEGHCVLEGAGGGPLRYAMAADETEENGGDDAVGRADEEAGVGH